MLLQFAVGGGTLVVVSTVAAAIQWGSGHLRTLRWFTPLPLASVAHPHGVKR